MKVKHKVSSLLHHWDAAYGLNTGRLCIVSTYHLYLGSLLLTILTVYVDVVDR